MVCFLTGSAVRAEIRAPSLIRLFGGFFYKKKLPLHKILPLARSEAGATSEATKSGGWEATTGLDDDYDSVVEAELERLPSCTQGDNDVTVEVAATRGSLEARPWG